MAILDLFKNKKEPEKNPVKKQALKPSVKKEKPTEKKEAPAVLKRVEKKQFSSAWRILKSAHVTEKASQLNEENQYVFKVVSTAGKQEIKKAIQDFYGVAVERVNLINVPEKKRRVGKHEGVKSGYKKAIVKLMEGEKIEILPR
ncbi:MAG: 50S ribosomal protein L23 [Candidatus Portnoybacteria bacterium]|nr:50S ribosomal protein L23 [Candidatus Portnoybacteria bacterium]